MNRNGFAPIVIVGILALLIALGVGGYFMWENLKQTPAAQQAQKSSSQPSSTPTQAPAPAAITTSTLDTKWNLFKNNVYGYSLKYPVSWDAHVQTAEADDVIFRNTFDPSAATSSFLEILYGKQGNASLKSVTQLASDFSEHLPNPPNSISSTTAVGGYPAIQIEAGDIGVDLITLITRGADVMEIDNELYGPDSTSTSVFAPDYQAMIRSIAFTL